MSHFSSVKTALRDRASLKAGLEAILQKINPDASVEEYEVPTLLINDYDRNDEKYAHLVIRRSDLSTDDRRALIDIGFLQDEDGIFRLQADAWDINRNSIGEHFGNLDAFLAEVQLKSEMEFVKQQFPFHLWDYETAETLEDGTIRMVIHQKQAVTTSNLSW